MQALKTETIPFLVGLLETGLEAVENMAATKAQIVKALKAMQLSLKYGEQVRQHVSHEIISLTITSHCDHYKCSVFVSGVSVAYPYFSFWVAV